MATEITLSITIIMCTFRIFEVSVTVNGYQHNATILVPHDLSQFNSFERSRDSAHKHSLAKVEILRGLLDTETIRQTPRPDLNLGIG